MVAVPPQPTDIPLLKALRGFQAESCGVLSTPS